MKFTELLRNLNKKYNGAAFTFASFKERDEISIAAINDGKFGLLPDSWAKEMISNAHERLKNILKNPNFEGEVQITEYGVDIWYSENFKDGTYQNYSEKIY